MDQAESARTIADLRSKLRSAEETVEANSKLLVGKETEVRRMVEKVKEANRSAESKAKLQEQVRTLELKVTEFQAKYNKFLDQHRALE